MQAKISTELEISAERAWQLVKQSKTLHYVCKGLLGFSGKESFPDSWRQGETVQTRLQLFNLIPAWKHSLYFKRISDTDYILLTQEQGGAIKSWQHEIKFEAMSEERCRYTDRVNIEAGVLTPLIWFYAHILYRYRQRRWRQMVRR